MPYLALALYALFLLLAFGLRTVVHYRETGSSGLRLPPPGTPVVERLGGILFLAALLLGIAAPFLTLTGVLELVGSLNRPFLLIVGQIFYAAGLAITVWSQATMGRSWRIGVDPSERTALVTRGPFASVRNPIFSAMLLATAGLVLLVPNAAALLSFVMLLAGVELQVRLVEEPYLMRSHGEAYARYAASAGRFVPGVGRLGANSGSVSS